MTNVLNIAVCDDDPIQVETIKAYINALDMNYEFNVIAAFSGEALLKRIKDHEIHIAFLDIQMKEMDGIELGKQIKAIYKNVIIVYITGFKDYAFHAFRVKAVDYMLKPVTEKRNLKSS